MWTSRLTLEHQVDVDNYEGQTKKFISYLLMLFIAFFFNFLNELIGLLKSMCFIDLMFLGDLEQTIKCFHVEMEMNNSRFSRVSHS
jgi:hypothetical protein